MSNICLTQKNLSDLNWGGDNVIENNTKLCTIGYSLSHFGAKRKDGYTDTNTYPDNRIVTGTNTSSPIEVEKAEVAPDYQYSSTYLKVYNSDGSELPPRDQHKFDYKTKSYLVKAIDVYVDSVSGSQKEEPSNGSFSKSINTDGLNSKIGIIISDDDITLSEQTYSQCLINKINNGQLSFITLNFTRSAGGSASIQFGYSDGRTNKDAIFYYDESSITYHNTTGNNGYYSCKFKLSEDYDISIKNSIKFAPSMYLTYVVDGNTSGEWRNYFNEPAYRTYSDTEFPDTSYGVINSMNIARPMPHGTPINYTFNDMKQNSNYDVYYNDDYYGDVKIEIPSPEPVSTYEVRGLLVKSANGSTAVRVKVNGAIVEIVQGTPITNYYFDENANAIRHIDESGYHDYIVFTKGSGSSNGTISIVNGLNNVPSGTFYLSITAVSSGVANEINYSGNQVVQLKD